jgi:hypothetical protein
VNQQPAPTTDEIANYIGHNLQYFFLRSIDEIQSRMTVLNYNSNSGTTSTTTSPVEVPDPQEYDQQKLFKLFDKLNLAFQRHAGSDDWTWRDYKLKVPRGTTVDFQDEPNPDGLTYVLRFHRGSELRVDFGAQCKFWNKGRGALPPDFVPEMANSIRTAYGFVFVVTMHFRWNGDRIAGSDYLEWAQGLEDGLSKRLDSTRQAPEFIVQMPKNSIVNNAPNQGSQSINLAPAARTVDGGREQAFKEALQQSPEGAITIVKAGTSDDIGPLESQLRKLATEVGWGVDLVGDFSVQGDRPEADGLRCYSANGWTAMPALALKNALVAANIECEYVNHPYQFDGITFAAHPTLVIGRNTVGSN